jgi:hypothetical protein
MKEESIADTTTLRELLDSETGFGALPRPVCRGLRQQDSDYFHAYIHSPCRMRQGAYGYDVNARFCN